MKEDNNYLAGFAEGPARTYGEIGIIREIVRILDLPEEMRWCVEFGAGNGVSASNSKYFIDELKYKAVLIEPMKIRFQKLDEIYADNGFVYTLNRFIKFSGPDSLDVMLTTNNVPNEFAFMSIDIDGNDYHIWDSLTSFQPILVCIEINETVPHDITFVQEKNFKVNQGCGIKSMTDLANSKGYELICVSENNAFYVVKKYYHLFQIKDNSLEVMCRNQSSYTKMFFGYDGTIFIEGEGRLRWHSTLLDNRKLQILPTVLRKFPPNYTGLERFLFRLWRFAYSPRVFIRSIKGKMGASK